MTLVKSTRAQRSGGAQNPSWEGLPAPTGTLRRRLRRGWKPLPRGDKTASRLVRTASALALFILTTVAANAAVNVRDFGAKGDGKTDDAKAIAAALDAVKTAGGTVDFPEGDYLLGTPAQTDAFFRLPSNVSLIGHGRARLLSTNKTALMSGVGVHDIRVEDLSFQSPERAFYFDNVNHLTITRCEFLDHQPMAIYAKRCSEVDVTDCRFAGSAYGFYLPKPIRWRISRNRIDTTGRGMELQAPERCQITDNLIQGMGQGAVVGILLFPSNDVSLGGGSAVFNLIANNEVNNMTEEAISCDCRGNDPAWYWRTGGAVASATENSVRLKDPVLADVKRCPGSHLAIYAGTGAGQFALVDSVENDTLKIRGRWQVLPDETSRVAVVNGFEGNQILGNRVQRSATGICLWGSSFQCQVIGNTLSDISGTAIAAFGLHLSRYQDAAGVWYPTLAPCWYNQIHSNTILRAVGKPDQVMIALDYQTYPKTIPYPFTNYGNSVRGNTVCGAPVAVQLNNQTQAEVIGNALSWCGTAVRLGETCQNCVVEPNTQIGCGVAKP